MTVIRVLVALITMIMMMGMGRRRVLILMTLLRMITPTITMTMRMEREEESWQRLLLTILSSFARDFNPIRSASILVFGSFFRSGRRTLRRKGFRHCWLTNSRKGGAIRAEHSGHRKKPRMIKFESTLDRHSKITETNIAPMKQQVTVLLHINK